MPKNNKEVITPASFRLNPYSDPAIYNRESLKSLLDANRREQEDIKNYKSPNGLMHTRQGELRELETQENYLLMALTDINKNQPALNLTF